MFCVGFVFSPDFNQTFLSTSERFKPEKREVGPAPGAYNPKVPAKAEWLKDSEMVCMKMIHSPLGVGLRLADISHSHPHPHTVRPYLQPASQIALVVSDTCFSWLRLSVRFLVSI
jgi:hypothetical protein